MDILLRLYLRAQDTIALLREREEGQGIAELALVIASMAIVLIAARLFLSEEFNAMITAIGQPGP